MHRHNQDHGQQEPYNVQDQFDQHQEEDGYPDYQREQVEKMKARRARNSKIQNQDGSREREFSDSRSPRQYERPNKFQAPWHTEEAPNGAPVMAPQSRLGREYYQQQQSFNNNDNNQDEYDEEEEEYQEPQLHSLNIREEHDQYQPPYLKQKAENQVEAVKEYQQSVQIEKDRNQNAEGSAIYPGAKRTQDSLVPIVEIKKDMQRPNVAQSNVKTGQASGHFAEPKQNEAVKNNFDQNNQNQLDGPNQNLRKSPDDEIDPFESEPENDSAEFDEGPIIGSQTPVKPLESKAFSDNNRSSMVKNPQNLHNKVMKKSRISPQRQVISIKTDKSPAQNQHISFVPNAWAHNQSPPSSGSKLRPKEQNWQSIQEQIDYDYQRKLKQVSDEAMRQLRQFQSEHREQITKNKMEYNQRGGALQDAKEPVGRIRGRRDSSQPRNVFSSQGFRVPNDRNRFFSPQTRVESQQTFEIQAQPPQNRNEQEFKQQYDAIIDSDQEIMLVDVLDKMKMLRDQRNDHESQESLYNFLKGSNKNIIIKSDYIENQNSQDTCTNLFLLLCAIQNYEVPHEYDLPVFDEKLLVSYINNINFDRDDADLIVIDQVISIRSIINRPAFVLSADQQKLISAKFRNMAENRLRSSPYQTPTRFQQIPEDDELKSYPRLMTPPPRNHGHQQIYETDNEQSRNLDQKSNEKVNDQYQKQIEQYRPATPMIASHIGYTQKLQNRNIVNPDILKQQELDQQLLGEPDSAELKKPKVQPKLQPQGGFKLRPDQIQELYQAFRAIDIDQSGLVTKRELTIMLKGQLQPDQINEIIQKVDQNKDGFISFSEFLNAASTGELNQVLNRVEPAQAEHLPDGRITRGSIRQSQQDSTPQQQFRLQQSRQTGRNQPLQEDQYEDYPKAQPAKQHRVPIHPVNSPSLKNILSQEQINELKIAFRQFDKNNDGVLSKREVKNMLRPLSNEIDPADIDKIIEKADTNGDGVISFKEFMNAITNGTFTGNSPRPKERKQQYVPKPPQQIIRKEPERKQLKTPERKPVRQPEKPQFKTEAKPRIKPAPPIKTLNATLAQKYQLTPEQIKTLRLQFMKADLDKNGTLTKRELNMFLRRQAIYIPEQQLQQLMDSIDDDGNGEISLEEFIAACSGIKPAPSVSPVRDNVKEPKNKKVQKSNSRPAPPRLDHKGYSTDTFKRDKGYQPDQTNDKIFVANHRQQPSNAKLTTQNSSETDLNQPERLLTKEQLQELQHIFQEVDADQDGVLTKKELRFFLKNLKGGPKLSNQAFNQIIDEADTNKDGLINFNEFIETQLGSKIVKMKNDVDDQESAQYQQYTKYIHTDTATQKAEAVPLKSENREGMKQAQQQQHNSIRKSPFENYLETKEQRKKLEEQGKSAGAGGRQYEENKEEAPRGQRGSLVFHEQQRRTEAVHGKNVKKELEEAQQEQKEENSIRNHQLIGHSFNQQDHEAKQEMDFEPNDTYQNYMDQKSLDAEETLNEYAQEKPQTLSSSDPDQQKDLQVIRAKSVTRSQRSQASKTSKAGATTNRRMKVPHNAYQKEQEQEHIMEIDLDGDIIKIYKGEKPYDIVERLKVKYNLSERSELRLFEQIMNEFQNNQ